jgi:D-glycero-D-manno-heptose 1,7-bisphosphate phosphatase
MVTNQSGIASQIFDIPLLERIHRKVEEHLAGHGARLDAIYFCPHLPDAVDHRFRTDCECRKPRPGMLLRAAEEHGITLERSWFIGDSVHDMAAAREAGVKAILVLTGYGRGELEFRIRPRGLEPAHIAEDISAAVDWILDQEEAAPRGDGAGRGEGA